jgi:hypothetical protein
MEAITSRKIGWLRSQPALPEVARYSVYWIVPVNSIGSVRQRGFSLQPGARVRRMLAGVHREINVIAQRAEEARDNVDRFQEGGTGAIIVELS